MDNRNQGITEDKGMHQTGSKIAKTIEQEIRRKDGETAAPIS